MYKYVVNSVAQISLMFAQYFEYYGVILRGPFLSWTHGRVSNCCLSIYLNITELWKSPGKMLWGSWKVLEKSWNLLWAREWEPCVLCSVVCDSYGQWCNNDNNKWSKLFYKKAASLPHMDSSVVFARLRQYAPPLMHASLHQPKSATKMSFWSIQPLCAAHGKVSLYFTKGHPFLLHNCLFIWGIWTPSNTWFLEPSWVHNPNSISIGSAVFAALMIVTDQPTDYTTPKVDTHFTILWRVEGWVDPRHCSKGVQPEPKAVYLSGCCEIQCPRWDSNLDCPLTLQSGMLPLYPCDLGMNNLP